MNQNTVSEINFKNKIRVKIDTSKNMRLICQYYDIIQHY
jgi:hypothetical protein